MKKHIIPLLLVLALSLSLLFGCTEGNQGDQGESGSDYSFADHESSGAPGENPPPEPEKKIEAPETIKAFFEENGTGEEIKQFAVPSYASETDTEFLYKLTFTAPNADGYSIYANGDLFEIICYKHSGASVYLYSLESGTLVYEGNISQQSNSGLLSSGGFWIFDYNEYELTFLGKNGKENTVDIPKERDSEISSACLSANGKYLAIAYTETQPFVIYNLETMEKESPETEGTKQFYTVSENGGVFALTSDKGDFTLYNTETREIKTIEGLFYSGTVYGALYSTHVENSAFIGSLKSDAFYYHDFGRDEYLSAVHNGLAVGEIYGEVTTLQVLSFADSLLLSEFSLCDGDEPIFSCFAPDGRLFVGTKNKKTCEIYYFDTYSALKAGGVSKIEGLSATVEELKAATDKIASELEEYTEIDLLYAGEGNDFVIYDYIGAAETNPFNVYKAVKTVDEILRKYPKGMLKEVYSDTHKALKIYLCATIYGINGGALGTAGGVTTDGDGEIIIAVDVHNNLKQDIPHELSHAFDRRIGYVSSNGETDWLAEWVNATPMSDAYADTYENYFDNCKYTPGFETDTENVWFVDDYARTFPTEDRARIMEYLFNCEGELNPMLNYPHLIEKAQLYAEILRECFPSCRNATDIIWEKYI